MLKASRGESKIPICRILNLCLQPSGIVVAWDSDLPLFLLSPYLTHLPLWLPHWHMNAIFHPSSFLPSFVPSSLHLVSSLPLFLLFLFYLSPSVSVWFLLGDCSSTNGNMTRSCLLNSQCGHELWAPRNSKGQKWRKKTELPSEASSSTFIQYVSMVTCAQIPGLHKLLIVSLHC